MTLVAGIDSSTQSTKVLLCDAADGSIVASGQAAHPAGTECDPRAWWQALRSAGDGLLERAAAISVAAQQHGMVALDDGGDVIRPALLWNDTRSARQTHDLITEGGGEQAWADSIGSLPTVSFTITKLRWLAEAEPDNAAQVATVMLPHDWITWKLRGGAVSATEATTDRGDASGTGYWSAAAENYRPDLLRLALGHDAQVPRVAAPYEVVGRTPEGAVLGPGTGDNAAAALGLGMGPGDVAVSIGTSGTAFASSDVAAVDPTGDVAGFADATGRHLPLVCTLNAARVLDTIAETLNCGHDELAELALAAPAGADGLVFLPYLDGERTPHRPTASGVMSGLTTAAMNRRNLARAAVEGMLCGLADALEALETQGVRADTVHLIGGGAASEAVRHIAPGVFGTAVHVPAPAEYVALGAARQAAWALAGTPQPPQWPQAPGLQYHAPHDSRLRHRYAALREETAEWRDHRLSRSRVPRHALAIAGHRRPRRRQWVTTIRHLAVRSDHERTATES